MEREQVRTDLIVDLLSKETAATRKLFSRALNIYVSPEAVDKTDKEKLDMLRKILEESPD
jgi:hypothetical protein